MVFTLLNLYFLLFLLLLFFLFCFVNHCLSFVLFFFLAIVLSVLLWNTASNCLFDIIKLFFCSMTNFLISKASWGIFLHLTLETCLDTKLPSTINWYYRTENSRSDVVSYSNMTSFFRFVDKHAIYRWYNLIRTCSGECDWLFHWQHKLCATFSAKVNIHYRLPIKVYYRICTLRRIIIEINHGSQNVFWVLTWVDGY